MTDLFDIPPKPVPADRLEKPEDASPTDPREHRCALCGRVACFGFGVNLRAGHTGRWACAMHRAQVAVMK